MLADGLRSDRNPLQSLASQMRRNQIVLSTVFVLTGIGVVGAQSAVPLPAVRYGLVVGLNSSTMSGDVAKDVLRLTGLIGGILLNVPVSANFAIQPELLLSMKGARLSDPHASEPYHVVTHSGPHIDYAEIPILLRFDVPRSGKVKPFFYGGPALSFKVSCEFDAEGLGGSFVQSCDEAADGGAEFKSIDYGLVVGGGLAFDRSNRRFTVSARYNHGLANVADPGSAKNRVISLIVTWTRMRGSATSAIASPRGSYGSKRSSAGLLDNRLTPPAA